MELYKTCKVPVKSSLPTNQHPAFLQARCLSCHRTKSVKTLKESLQNRIIFCFTKSYKNTDPSPEVINSGAELLQIYSGICTPKIIKTDDGLPSHG